VGSGTDARGSGAGGAAGRERRVRSGQVALCVVEFGPPADPAPGPAGERGSGGAGAAGTAPTIVLVHGYPDSKEVWLPVAERLARRFHVVLYDVRGHGRSSAPEPLRGGFTLERLTDDFLAGADAVSPGRPVHLVGHDWGSVQGWEFATAERTRGRVASFTSISGPSLDHTGAWVKDRLGGHGQRRPGDIRQLLVQGAKSWYVWALHAPGLPELAWRGPLSGRWPDILARVEGLPRGGAYPTDSLPRDAEHGAWLYRDNVRAHLRAPRAAFAHVPVQLIVPTRDAYLSERLYDDLDRWVPRLTRRTVPARHWLPRNMPDRVAAWIADFADEREAEPAERQPGGGAARQSSDARDAPEVPDAARAVGARAVRGRAADARRAAHAARFGGRLVLVTGAASGIGRATALAFAAAGARVVAVDLDGEGAAGTADLARRSGAPEAWGEWTDVGDEAAMERLAATVADTYGIPDVLVNNAGIGMSGPFLDTTADDWRRILDVNLWGVLHGCRLFGRQMAERGRGGHIVNTASAAAYQPSRALPAYCTSKAAVLMLSECLRAELAGQGIGVSAICPGFVHTGITATARFTGVSAAEEERLRAKVSRLYGLRHFPPEKVADAVLRAVVRNEAVVPVTPEAHGLRALSRLAGGAVRAIARTEPPL
jgi:NAD(P)-dependent dehydrogenase (short-subunit alcohol dehydrogenase family)/pimeloyl-ACP methyl ester carboxylesterase